MAQTGSNLTQVRTYNETLILDAIRRSGGISRIELAGKTGLVPQTVTNICRRLLEGGLIEEAGKAANGVGKPRTLLRLRPEGRFAVGVLLDPAELTLVLLDLSGEIRAHRTLPTPLPESPSAVIQAIAAEITDLVDESGVGRERVLGVGIGVPGPVDLSTGLVESPPHLPSRQGIPLRDELSAITGLPTLLDKDVVAAVVGENWRGGEAGDRGGGAGDRAGRGGGAGDRGGGAGDRAGRGGGARSAGSDAGPEALAVVYVGTGIGVGVSIDGEVVRGASGNAGEVGHIVVDPDGPPCVCGLRGCVAVVSDPAAVVERLSGVNTPAEVGRTLAEIMASLQVGERERVIDAALAGLVRLTLVVADLYDVDHVVYGGPFWRHLRDRFVERALPLLRSAPAAHSIHGVRIESSALGDDLGAVGAGSLVLDWFLRPRASALMLPQ